MAPRVNPNKFGEASSRAGWDFLGVFDGITADTNKGLVERGIQKNDEGTYDLSWWDRRMGADEAHIENRVLNRDKRLLDNSTQGQLAEQYGLETSRGETKAQLTERNRKEGQIRTIEDALGVAGGVHTGDRTIASLSEALRNQKDENYENSAEGRRDRFQENRLTASDNRANTALDNQNNIAERTLDQQGEKMSADERRFFAQMEMSRADNAANRLQEIRLMQMKSDADELRYQQDREYYEQDKQQAALAALVASLASLGGAFTI